MKKALISVIACLAIIATLALPAFAGTDTQYSGDYSITVTCTEYGSSHGIYGPAGSSPFGTARVWVYLLSSQETWQHDIGGSSYSSYWLAYYTSWSLELMLNASTYFKSTVATAYP